MVPALRVMFPAASAVSLAIQSTTNFLLAVLRTFFVVAVEDLHYGGYLRTDVC